MEKIVPFMYLTNEYRLWEVVEANATSVQLRNVATESVLWIPRSAAMEYRIVWPECPDLVDTLS